MSSISSQSTAVPLVVASSGPLIHRYAVTVPRSPPLCGGGVGSFALTYAATEPPTPPLPPCGEGSGVGVEEWSKAVPRGTPPHPNPPPQGGRESQRHSTALSERKWGVGSAGTVRPSSPSRTCVTHCPAAGAPSYRRSSAPNAAAYASSADAVSASVSFANSFSRPRLESLPPLCRRNRNSRSTVESGISTMF